ncbi:TIGR04100 family radical SAM protein [Eubacterium sp. am_0171]|uniref:TIGR04100 family radical SAM protein n=1 Tax=Clostridia TaxID=186801 RepID=UPI00067E6CD6|nr:MULTISPECIES: TIGR04100 family radical SAM protein [Clostridia]MSC83125.1 TIGR04100 family radical SAM protein [Eubacterium sp. BIOML-A1]MSD05613.1 TIGR04100 family radical SAM protein [Eubacterium sp. BIOML-A2]RYT24513.1 TIGR04100 family radical SAM protein [Eubacterium sp. am_0171]
MADILYTYKNQVYANITNLCDCRCEFCIRSHEDGVGDAETLWHKKDPSLEEIIAAMDEFDFQGYKELVYCGYGEPTCALENLVKSAKYAKEKYGVLVRINTNGLGNLYHGKDIVPILAEVADSISISLNAPTKEEYTRVTRPNFENAFEALLEFAGECEKMIPQVKMTVVDVLPEEEIEASRELAESIGVELRVRRYA